VAHRLDRDTSGLLLVARSEAVLEELQRMMRAREITTGCVAGIFSSSATVSLLSAGR
jgi:23S rRNA-/tRNA-specific pseudouridylate synthase